jgi:LPS export ABC transporter protein LptC
LRQWLKQKLSYRPGAALVIGLLGLTACQPPEPPKISPTESPKIEETGRLILNNATLEQANPSGQPLWKIQVKKATYTQDQKIARLENVKGNIYQDGKIVLQVSADRGEVYKEGQEILLKDNIVAVDPRNKAIIKAPELRWLPKEGILVSPKGIQGSHLQLEASAREGHYDTRQEKLELRGQVVATAKESRIVLQTERLYWEVPQQVISTDQKVAFDRYVNKTIIDRLTAIGARWERKNNQVILQENLEYRSLEPPLQISSSQASWNYQDRILTSDRPTEIFQYQDNITLTGNRVLVELGKRMAYLKDGVKGINQNTGAKLYSQILTWKMSEKIVEAEGNIIYEQQEPKFNLTGDKAIGTLEDNNIVVSSSSPERVVTEIYPR